MTRKFDVNDYVIYGKSGLCFVKEIKKMRMANGPLSDYYILNSATGNAVTIYVPCDKENLVAKMRRPMTKEEIDRRSRTPRKVAFRSYDKRPFLRPLQSSFHYHKQQPF